MTMREEQNTDPAHGVLLFLCGDVMTGRGIDQVLPHPAGPRLFENYVKDARDYVRLAEEKNGRIRRPVPFSYIWGEALAVLEDRAPDLRLINLETAVTKNEDHWKGKGINYRMHPENIPCLTAAHIDFCSLANNHVLDWGYEGLAETIRTLEEAGIKSAGAGSDRTVAFRPAAMGIPEKGRVIVFSFGQRSSGIPADWAATEERSGLNLLDDLSPEVLRRIRTQVTAQKQTGDLLIASVHWGGNWGYEIPEVQKDIAHRLIDEADFDLIHGHSSHHVKGIELYRGKPIFYGCGDFLNDYEGIGGYEMFRADLTLMYFVGLDPAGRKPLRLEMQPMQIRNFRLEHPSKQDASWLFQVMKRECGQFGGILTRTENGTFSLST